VINIKTAETGNHTQQPTIALSPDGEVYVPAEEKDGVSGIPPEVSTTVPDRDVVLCIPVWLLDKTTMVISPGAQLMIEWITTRNLTKSFEPEPSSVSSLACTRNTFCSLSSFSLSRIHLDVARADQDIFFLVFFCLKKPRFRSPGVGR
jgi:hypothetical protein